MYEYFHVRNCACIVVLPKRLALRSSDGIYPSDLLVS